MKKYFFLLALNFSIDAHVVDKLSKFRSDLLKFSSLITITAGIFEASRQQTNIVQEDRVHYLDAQDYHLKETVLKEIEKFGYPEEVVDSLAMYKSWKGENSIYCENRKLGSYKTVLFFPYNKEEVKKIKSCSDHKLNQLGQPYQKTWPHVVAQLYDEIGKVYHENTKFYLYIPVVTPLVLLPFFSYIHSAKSRLLSTVFIKNPYIRGPLIVSSILSVPFTLLLKLSTIYSGKNFIRYPVKQFQEHQSDTQVIKRIEDANVLNAFADYQKKMYFENDRNVNLMIQQFKLYKKTKNIVNKYIESSFLKKIMMIVVNNPHSTSLSRANRFEKAAKEIQKK